MKKSLFTLLIVLLTRIASFAQNASVDNQLVYNFYSGTSGVISCYTVTNYFNELLDDKNFNPKLIKAGLSKYILSMDKLTKVAVKNEFFDKDMAQISIFVNDWENTVKAAIVQTIANQSEFNKSDLKNFVKKLYPLTDKMASLYGATNDRWETKITAYNTKAIQDLVNALPNSTLDTFTFKGYKQITKDPIKLNVFDENCDYCLEGHYSNDVEMLKKILPKANVVVKDDMTVFVNKEGNSLVIAKIKKEPFSGFYKKPERAIVLMATVLEK